MAKQIQTNKKNSTVRPTAGHTYAESPIETKHNTFGHPSIGFPHLNSPSPRYWYAQWTQNTLSGTKHCVTLLEWFVVVFEPPSLGLMNR